MICNDQACSCGIVSDSLTITGSGAIGDPFQIETNAFAIVTSATRPPGFLGQHIFETDTGRDLYYDGADWVIISNFPEFQIEAQSAQSVPDGGSGLTPTLPTEVADSDAFHAGTDGFVTVPGGLGGRYLLIAQAQFAAHTTGYRFVRPVVANNAGAPTQNGGDRTGGYAMISTANNGFISITSVLLAAAATVTLSVFQTSGAPLDVNACSLKGVMQRHIPALV